MDRLFLGSVVHCKSLNELETIENGFIVVNKGRIFAIGDQAHLPKDLLGKLPVTRLTSTQFLLPGFVDCHIHAPQYPNLGLGLDLPLLEWLEKYTFPLEAAFKDEKFAHKVYRAIVRRTIDCGTTLASYFATNYWESSMVLAKEAVKQGQRALIGKVCSNTNSPDYYVEKTSHSLRDTELFIRGIMSLRSPLVKPIITPRFALSCTAELMNGLSELAEKYNLHIQSHISENCDEIKAVKEMFSADSYASVYESVKLLTDKCVMAHGVHLEDKELTILKKYGTSVAHCPTSNTKLRSGFCEVRRLLNAGVTVGLGTDVSGGHNASMLLAIQDALNVSHSLNFVKKQNITGTGRIEYPQLPENKDYEPLEYQNVLYLATLGGARALSLDKVCGNFEVGKDFDALLIDVSVTPLDLFDVPPIKKMTGYSNTDLDELIQKFVYAGDDRNIQKVFIAGKQVKGSSK